jgi:hypothetical protein
MMVLESQILTTNLVLYYQAEDPLRQQLNRVEYRVLLSRRVLGNRARKQTLPVDTVRLKLTGQNGHSVQLTIHLNVASSGV